MGFDTSKRTPISRTMFALNTHEPETDDLMHYGVQGQRWGVRRAVGPNGLIKRTVKAYRGSYLGKAFTKTGKKYKQKQLNKAIAKALAKKKSPKDMSDSELKDAYSRNTSKKNLQAAVKSKVLDDVSKAMAAKTLREMEFTSSADLKKESDRITERGRQLTELRPSNSAKQGVGWKIAKAVVKATVDTDTILDIAIGATTTKKISKEVVKDAMTSKRKKGITETQIRKEISTTKNQKIDDMIDKVWAKRIDKKGGF